MRNWRKISMRIKNVKKISRFEPKLRMLEKQKSRDIDALNVEIGYMTGTTPD